MSSQTVVARPESVSAQDLAYVAVFAALIAALSLAPAIPLGALGVPITLQTLGVALTGLCLGPWRAVAAVGLYVAAGAAGLPVFAQGRAGIGVLAGPTGGYIISFILAALASGFLARLVVRRGLNRWTPVAFIGILLLVRYLVMLPIAMLGLMRALGLGAGEALAVDIPFWIGDLVKYIVAALLAHAVHKAFPRLLGRQ